MVKRQFTSNRRTVKKKEIFFNFNKLRRTLDIKEKKKIIKFFIGFRGVFKELQGNLYKLNQKFDVLETQIKNFQQNYLKEISSIPQKEDFVLNEDDLQQLLDSSDKKKSKEKEFNFDDYKDNFFDKDDEEENKNKYKETINNTVKSPKFKEKFFDYKKGILAETLPKQNITPNGSKINIQETKPKQKGVIEGGWIRK